MNYGTALVPHSISRGLAIERIAPYLMGIAAVVVYGVFGRQQEISPNIKDIFASTVSIAGAGAGFMLAAASILATISNSWFLKRAKEAGVFTRLVQYLLVAMGWCLATSRT